MAWLPPTGKSSMQSGRYPAGTEQHSVQSRRVRRELHPNVAGGASAPGSISAAEGYVMRWLRINNCGGAAGRSHSLQQNSMCYSRAGCFSANANKARSHSLNMKATSAAMVPLAGRPLSRKHSRFIQFLMNGSVTQPSSTCGSTERKTD